MKRLLLAPHLDDAAISFGGTLLAEGASRRPMLVGTVFSLSNYTRAGLGDASVVTPIRQAEEKAVMSSIGVDTLFLGFPECPLRGYTISDPLDYPRRIKPELDGSTVAGLAMRLEEMIADVDEVFVPLAAGERGHVDHRIVRLAAVAAWRKIEPGPAFLLYEDVPYITQAQRDRVAVFPGLRLREQRIDLDAKLDLIAGYASQPTESWEPLIRRAAGAPPVERTWLVSEPQIVEDLA